jgi:hypothetical protein
MVEKGIGQKGKGTFLIENGQVRYNNNYVFTNMYIRI